MQFDKKDLLDIDEKIEFICNELGISFTHYVFTDTHVETCSINDRYDDSQFAIEYLFMNRETIQKEISNLKIQQAEKAKADKKKRDILAAEQRWEAARNNLYHAQFKAEEELKAAAEALRILKQS